MATKLRLQAAHHQRLMSHLFPGDGREAVAFAVCGRHRLVDGEVLLVHDIQPIPYDDCPVREPDLVTWRSDVLEGLLDRAARKQMGVVKFHSHPTGFPDFSRTDDRSDQDLFPSIHGWVDDDRPHASVILLPDGSLIGREVSDEGQFHPLESILIVGDDITFAGHQSDEAIPAYAERHAQAFGTKTTAILNQLAIGVVGCSGTGSHVIEQLTRLGVRKLVLVDPDCVEHRNLNRIVGSTAKDAGAARAKVEVLADHVRAIGLGTEVVPVRQQLGSREAVMALAGCDIVFGCMDGHDGRRTLNRLSHYYLLPYFDCGVSLDADRKGGIEKVIAASHYFQPGQSNALDRGVISQEQADVEAMARDNPEEYARLRAQKYIRGVNESSPAVISINAVAAALAVNEMLARLHPYRGGKNRQYASVRFDLSEMAIDNEHERGPGIALSRQPPGRGDMKPLLEMPALSEQ